ncbi:MAG: hypothetical protein ACK504_02705 [Bacteroidota bacterium]
MNLFRTSGYLSFILGVACCLSLIHPKFLFFTLIFSMMGFVFSTINIYLNAKYEITKKTFSLGYLGMGLSSIPIIFLFILNMK